METKVAIIGGGLAGTSCAYFLKKEGYTPIIFEAGDNLASGASGNPVGLYNPRFYAEKTLEAEFYADAFLQSSIFFAELGDKISYSPHGSLHLINSEEKQKRFSRMKQNWGWSDDKMQLLSKEEASNVAGVEITFEGLFLPTSGTVSPSKLCQAYAEGIDVQLNSSVTEIAQKSDQWSVNGEDFDIVIFACGAGVRNFTYTDWLPVETIRGQITQFEGTELSRHLKTNLNYGGYITPSFSGVHTSGSTFQKWLDHTDVIEEDNDFILNKVKDVVPDFSTMKSVVNARASLRTSSNDRLPIIGQMVEREPSNREIIYVPNMYISSAHGSHGIVTSYMAAKLINQKIQGTQQSAYEKVVAPKRFLERQLRKAN